MKMHYQFNSCGWSLLRINSVFISPSLLKILSFSIKRTEAIAINKIVYDAKPYVASATLEFTLTGIFPFHNALLGFCNPPSGVIVYLNTFKFLSFILPSF